jgi:nicotinate phosphoribosyltransferase
MADPKAEGAGLDALALFTDYYELTMLQAYFEEGLTQEAVFSLFVRRIPVARSFLLACGLPTILDCLEQLRFSAGDLAYLATLGHFSEPFLASLADFRFTGEVWAVPEGTPLFANEPILEIVAPLPQAQLIETLVMNQIHLQTLLASKAQRVVSAAAGRPVIDFASRRMHGLDAALKGARAFYLGGVNATSNVLAGKLYGVPVAGTMAHSYIQAHDSEAQAFAAFVRLYPDTVLLVDTYDTLSGVRKVIDLAGRLGPAFQVKALRLDSGDLATLAQEARQLLDQAGLQSVGIFVSGGLDEKQIIELLASGAPIDGFGVGTSMGVSSDMPALDMAYKLCEYGGKGRLKLSIEKPVLPGRKQIFRQEEHGQDVGDVIARADETLPGRPLLAPVMRNGRRLPAGAVSLEAARQYAQKQIARLPMNIRGTEAAATPYPVAVSSALAELQSRIGTEASR